MGVARPISSEPASKNIITSLVGPSAIINIRAFHHPNTNILETKGNKSSFAKTCSGENVSLDPAERKTSKFISTADVNENIIRKEYFLLAKIHIFQAKKQRIIFLVGWVTSVLRFFFRKQDNKK